MTKEEVDVGIDPGMTGALSALGVGIALADMMPVIPGVAKKSKTTIDEGLVVDWFKKQQAEFTIRSVCIEKQQAFPKQGSVSNFTTGDTYGLLRGITIALGLPLVIVRPQEWKKIVLTGTAKDKTAAIHYVRHRYPNVDLDIGKIKVIYSDGMADALCIADYSRRLQHG